MYGILFLIFVRLNFNFKLAVLSNSRTRASLPQTSPGPAPCLANTSLTIPFYSSYNSNDGFGRVAEQLNFAAAPSEDEAEYPAGAYLKKGKVSRASQTEYARFLSYSLY